MAYDNTLVGDFGATGLWQYDGAAWTQIAGDADNSGNTMIPYGGGMAVDFGANGLWHYDGADWTQLDSRNVAYILSVHMYRNTTVVEATQYMPFGGQRDHTGSVTSNYKFTDQELDPETGLYNYNARLYDPIIGRFISPDTIVQAPYDPQTLNRYSYCRNNPLIYVDPSGHGFFKWLKRQWKRFRKWNRKEHRFNRWCRRNNISFGASVNVSYNTATGSGVPDYGRRSNNGSWNYTISYAVAYSKFSSNRQMMLADTMNILADPSYWEEFRPKYGYGMFFGGGYLPFKYDVLGPIKKEISRFFYRIFDPTPKIEFEGGNYQVVATGLGVVHTGIDLIKYGFLVDATVVGVVPGTLLKLQGVVLIGTGAVIIWYGSPEVKIKYKYRPLSKGIR